MNDGHDPLFAVRSYSCEKSRIARDKWLSHREQSNMPVTQQLQRFESIPPAFARQYERARNKFG